MMLEKNNLFMPFPVLNMKKDGRASCPHHPDFNRYSVSFS